MYNIFYSFTHSEIKRTVNINSFMNTEAFLNIDYRFTTMNSLAIMIENSNML